MAGRSGTTERGGFDHSIGVSLSRGELVRMAYAYNRSNEAGAVQAATLPMPSAGNTSLM